MLSTNQSRTSLIISSVFGTQNISNLLNSLTEIVGKKSLANFIFSSVVKILVSNNNIATVESIGFNFQSFVNNS
jgi:hypothetical protein